ncbi:MAG: D-glycero-beta-D-manno-heptose 1-phosphate adenylyltransferase [candidate division Zixibacteria bacterium]|nr:D-glycero-beta-D-manno-heptose 1-phosphate adenylyltransferase [candidate division Zixibacteria bacterium]
MISGNLISRSKVPSLISGLKRKHQAIVFTNGVFDILHRGHVEYLAKAKEFGDILIVGLNSDASVRRLKGTPRPLQRQQDRAAVLLALKAVDYVVVFGEDTPEKLIKSIEPDVLVKGADYKLSEIVGAQFVKSYGGKIQRIRLTKGRSTSDILKRIREN